MVGLGAAREGELEIILGADVCVAGSGKTTEGLPTVALRELRSSR